MKLAGIFVAALTAVSLTTYAVPFTSARLGAELAKLLSTYAPVELFRQQTAIWRLSGGTPPAPEAARAALEKVEAQLEELKPLIAEEGPHWAPLLPAIQTASQLLSVATEALAGPGLEERPPEDQEALLGTLGEARKALDELVIAASDAAEAAEEGWEFQASFLAQTVLLSPSPLYLRIQEEWQAYLRRNLPPWFPEEGVSALDGLLALANQGLTLEQEAEARAAAEELLSILIPEGYEGGT